MAATESQLEAGRRLARDLRTIRRKRGVDLKEVMDATRLADDVIEQLEESALIGHPAFNHVYLRSLFGVHASVLKVDRADMMQALEEVFSGHYVGSLAQKYLGAQDVSAEDDQGQEKEGADSRDSLENQSDLVTEVESHAVENSEEHPAESPDPGNSSKEESGSTVAPSESLEEPLSEDVDKGEDSSLDVPDHKGFQHIRSEPSTPSGGEGIWSGLADRKTVLLPNMSGAAVLIIAGVAMIALIWFAVSWVINLGDEESVAFVQRDSLSVESVPMPDPIVLPDTFAVDIVAYTEALDPVRVTVDRDLRKSYWVEHLEQRRFLVTDRIKVEREVEHTRILVDGYQLPQEWLEIQEPLDISRVRVQRWLDSLTTSGVVPRKETSAP